MKGLRILLVAGVIAACNRDDATYTIAQVSTWNEAYGLMARQGTELAVETINKRGGVRSHRLALVRVDDEGTGAKAAARGRSKGCRPEQPREATFFNRLNPRQEI